MSTPQFKILYEYDEPVPVNYILNDSAGLWFLVLSPGDVVVTDDHSQPAYYPYTNTTEYNVKSARVDTLAQTVASSKLNCLATDSSIFYDESTTRMYFHFKDFDPPYGKEILIGSAVGLSLGDSDEFYYNDVYYNPLVDKVFSIKKNKDALFFGLLKFTSGTVTLNNTEGDFDNWKSRNLYAQPSRLLIGERETIYSNLETIYTGSIGASTQDHKKIDIKNEDIRKRLTQPIASNLLNNTDWPKLLEDNIDVPKPVVYGSIRKAESICLNEKDTGASTFTFLLCDTEFNNVASLDLVLVEGAIKIGTLNASAGTFTLPDTDYTPGDEVFTSFTVAITNGVDVIKDLIENYDDKPYLSSFWNLTETAVAQAISSDISLYVDDDTTDLKSAIEGVASDISAIFFAQNDGLYSIRIFDSDRVYSKFIQVDDWIDSPKTKGNEDEFLTSVIIEYYPILNPGDDEKEYERYENLDYKDAAFRKYRTLKNKKITTNLTTESEAILKSQTILDVSSNVQDVITRSVPFRTDSDTFYNQMEIMDFILCDPNHRVAEDGIGNSTPNYAVYELLGIDTDISKFELKLTFGYIKPDPRIESAYNILVDEVGDFIVDEVGDFILIEEEAALA